jgi:hypothetical protein
MIRCDDVIKDAEFKSFLGFKKPVTPMIAILCKLEQKLFFVAAVYYVPNMAG